MLLSDVGKSPAVNTGGDEREPGRQWRSWDSSSDGSVVYLHLSGEAR